MRILGCLLLLSLNLCAQESASPNTAQGWIERGQLLLQQSRVTDAVASFRNAVNLDPRRVQAHSDLAIALNAQFVPRVESEANLRVADEAAIEWNAVLSLEPNNGEVLQQMVWLSINRRDYAAARNWVDRALSLDPGNKEMWLQAGGIAWEAANAEVGELRIGDGLNPAPIRDAAVRSRLRLQYGPGIDEGIAHLHRALDIDEVNGKAMNYLRMLHSLKAELEDRADAADAETAIANRWAKRLEETTEAQVTPTPAPSEPEPANIEASDALHIDGNIQAASLIHCVPADYLPLAREQAVSGVVRLDVTIEPDGRVSRESLVSGHPLLISAAMNAVGQYRYKPTLIGGAPVTVSTTIDVTFDLNGSTNCP